MTLSIFSIEHDIIVKRKDIKKTIKQGMAGYIAEDIDVNDLTDWLTDSAWYKWNIEQDKDIQGILQSVGKHNRKVLMQEIKNIKIEKLRDLRERMNERVSKNFPLYGVKCIYNRKEQSVDIAINGECDKYIIAIDRYSAILNAKLQNDNSLLVWKVKDSSNIHEVDVDIKEVILIKCQVGDLVSTPWVQPVRQCKQE